MLSISEFYESIREVNNDYKRNAVLTYCDEFLSVLKKKTYTTEDKELIEKFVTEGLYEKIINEHIADSEIRKKILDIRSQYRWEIVKKDSNLGKLYEDKNMFSILSTSVTKELKKTITPENLDEHINLLNDYVTRIVRSTCLNSLSETTRMQEYISVEEFQKLAAHKEISRLVERDRNGTIKILDADKSSVQEYIFNYMFFLRLNDKEIDFEKDELLKVLAPEEKDLLIERLRKQENISNRIDNKNFSEGNEKENVLAFCTDFLELLKKEAYTKQERELIEKFVTEGLYEKIINEHIADSEIREKILDIRAQYKWEVVKKDSNLGKLYEDKNMFSILSTSVTTELKKTITPENLDEHINLLNDYVIKMVRSTCLTSLSETTRMQEYMSVEEFQKLLAHKEIIQSIEIDRKGIGRSLNADSLNVRNYISNYVDFLIVNNKEPDFENDELLKILASEEKESFKEVSNRRKIILNDSQKTIDAENLTNISNDMLELLKRGNYSKSEEVVIRKYLKNIFLKNSSEKNYELLNIENEQLDRILCEEMTQYLSELDEEYEYTEKELETINGIANKIASKSYKKHKFEQYEKIFINEYFEKVFDKSVRKSIDSQMIRNTLKTLIKTQRFYNSNSKNILRDNHRKKINAISNSLDNYMFFISPKRIETMDETNLEETLYLIAYQNISNVDILQDGIEELKKRGVEDIYKSLPVKEFINNFIGICAGDRFNDKYVPNKELIIQFVCEYIDNVTKTEKFNLNENQGVSDILQLISAKKLPEEYITQINEVLEKNLNISQINLIHSKMKVAEIKNQYIKLLPNNTRKISPITDEKVFDELLENVQKIKLKNDLRVDDETLNLILYQVFDDNSVVRKNPQKYVDAIERTLEDFAFNDTCTQLGQLNQRKRCYFTRGTIVSSNSASVLGLNYPTHMFFKRSQIENFVKNKDLDVFDTIFHENTHAEQKHNGIKTDSYIKYIIEKEAIIRSCNPEFYNANYNEMFCEIDARTQAIRKLMKFLKKNNLNLSEPYIFASLLKKDMIEYSRETIKKEKERMINGRKKYKRIGDAEKVKVTEYFDELVRDNHEEILRNHPRLKIEYNDDGTLKTPYEFLKTAPEGLDRQQVGLYVNIIKRGNAFKPENLERDLTEIISVPDSERKNRILTAFTIIENVGRMVDELVPTVSKMPLERMISLSETFKMVNEHIENNPKGIIKLAMKKKSLGVKKSAHTKLAELDEMIQERFKEFSKEEIDEAYKNFNEKRNRTSNNSLQVEDIHVDDTRKKEEETNEKQDDELSM